MLRRGNLGVDVRRQTIDRGRIVACLQERISKPPSQALEYIDFRFLLAINSVSL
jgi:hypothetical protein